MALAVVASACGALSFDPPNGQQQCAAAGRRCPDGFECQPDNRCWRPGTAPISAAGNPRAGTVAGGVTASSERYRAVLTTGPGKVAQSERYRMVGGTATAATR